MKKSISVVLFVLFTITSFSQTSVTNYTDSGFAAKFPVTPRIENQTVSTKIGESPMTMYLCEGDDFMIMVSVNKFSIEIVQELDAKGSENMLNGSKNGALNTISKQMGGEFKTVNEEKYLFDGKYTALKVAGTINETDLKSNYILKSNQLFQILILGNVSAKGVVDFTSSFTLIN